MATEDEAGGYRANVPGGFDTMFYLCKSRPVRCRKHAYSYQRVSVGATQTREKTRQCNKVKESAKEKLEAK